MDTAVSSTRSFQLLKNEFANTFWSIPDGPGAIPLKGSRPLPLHLLGPDGKPLADDYALCFKNHNYISISMAEGVEPPVPDQTLTIGWRRPDKEKVGGRLLEAPLPMAGKAIATAS